jgi:hypothetical protein
MPAIFRSLAFGLMVSLTGMMFGCTGQGTTVAGQPQPSPASTPQGSNISGAFLFYEDFEHGLQKWTFSDQAPVAWRLLPTHSCGGAFAMLFGADKQASFSNMAADGYLTLNVPIDLTAAKHPMLTYQTLATSTPPAALTLQAEMSAQDGVWKPIGQGLQGNQPIMSTEVADLLPYVGQSLHLRFHATSQTAAGSSGMLLDTIEIIETGN